MRSTLDAGAALSHRPSLSVLPSFLPPCPPRSLSLPLSPSFSLCLPFSTALSLSLPLSPSLSLSLSLSSSPPWQRGATSQSPSTRDTAQIIRIGYRRWHQCGIYYCFFVLHFFIPRAPWRLYTTATQLQQINQATARPQMVCRCNKDPEVTALHLAT